MNTFVPKPSEIKRKWYVVDAQGQVLGRLASRVAQILNGKNDPAFIRNVDSGDFVVVINASGITATGRKLNQKMYYHHTLYPGGLKSRTLGQILSTHPERVIRSAVKGMLPKTILGKQMLTRLKVYSGKEHPHQAQKPEKLEF